VLGYLVVLIGWSVISLAALTLAVLLTNPLAIGPIGVTAWFVVLLLALAAAINLILYWVKTFMHVHATGIGRLRYCWRQGLLIGGWVTGLLALSSLHQLGLLDGILLALLFLIVEVYVRLRWP
jgi:hypothetical protein